MLIKLGRGKCSRNQFPTDYTHVYNCTEYRAYQFPTYHKDYYTPGWAALYPSWLGLWSELAWSLSTLLVIFIIHKSSSPSAAAFENLYCPVKVVIKFQAGGLLLLGFTTNCPARHQWPQKLGTYCAGHQTSQWTQMLDTYCTGHLLRWAQN